MSTRVDVALTADWSRNKFEKSWLAYNDAVSVRSVSLRRWSNVSLETHGGREDSTNLTPSTKW